jgi:hypothetical protein
MLAGIGQTPLKALLPRNARIEVDCLVKTTLPTFWETGISDILTEVSKCPYVVNAFRNTYEHR